MAAEGGCPKERNERYDIPEEGALILIHGRVHEVTETWEGTGPRMEELSAIPLEDPAKFGAGTLSFTKGQRPITPSYGDPSPRAART